ncbi:hypothetical protein [Phenylobacterium sp.]|jgi:hypothetical protein|uniref:hypothetical protein n=1 Tax=Phenylobacterium sp. TaxID=1871053 RepID=UPI0027321132|nr:hypothetical protein [Phenylobacterium sp.]MDP1873636.1 hypothetical protein [Phenylobacterium sp.]
MALPLQIPPVGVPMLDPRGFVTQPWRNFFENLVSRSGGIVGEKQDADPTLTALAGLNSGAGFVTQTGADAFTKRTLTGAAGQISVADGDGVAGNPTLSLANTAVTPGTFTVITSLTVDAKGRITGISGS